MVPLVSSPVDSRQCGVDRYALGYELQLTFDDVQVETLVVVDAEYLDAVVRCIAVGTCPHLDEIAVAG